MAPPNGRVEQPLDAAAGQVERPIAGKGRRPGRDQHQEDADAQVGRRHQAVADRRPPDDRRQRQQGSAAVVASCRPVDAEKAAAASPVSTPALRSISTVNGAHALGGETGTAKYHSRCDSDRHDPKTDSSVGSSRYSETAATNRSAADLTHCLHPAPTEEGAPDAGWDDWAPLSPMP